MEQISSVATQGNKPWSTNDTVGNKVLLEVVDGDTSGIELPLGRATVPLIQDDHNHVLPIDDTTHVMDPSRSFTSTPNEPESIKEMPSCLETKDQWIIGSKPWRVLNDTATALNSIDADYFLSSGTLLGFVRDCKVFKDDIDIGITLPWAEVRGNLRKLRDAMSAHGFFFRRGFNDQERSIAAFEETFIHKTIDEFRVDIFVVVTADGHMASSIHTGGGRTTLSCSKPFSHITTYNFGGTIVRVPEPAQDILRSHYGDTYMTPMSSAWKNKLDQAISSARCLVQNSKELEDCSKGKRIGLIVATTSAEITDMLQDWVDRSPKRICHFTAFENRSYAFPSIALRHNREQIGSIHEAALHNGLWMHLRPHDAWRSHLMATLSLESYLIPGDGKIRETRVLPQEYYGPLQYYWERLANAIQTVMLDRPVKLVAFDGGLDYRVGDMNTLDAAETSVQRGAAAVNIDLVVSVDGGMFGIENNTVFSIFPEAEGNRVLVDVSATRADVLANMTKPCLPEWAVRRWIDRPWYLKNYSCSERKLSTLIDFLHGLPGTQIVIDLKAPTLSLQLEQARRIVALANQSSAGSMQDREVTVRFFHVQGKRLATGSFLPDVVFDALGSDNSLSQLKYHINAPSKLACHYMVTWIRTNRTFKNRNIAGCFIIDDHPLVLSTWETLSRQRRMLGGRTGQKDRTFVSSVSTEAICDVPRLHPFPNASLFRSGLIDCIIGGYDAVHDPFQVSRPANHARIASGVPGDIARGARRVIRGHLVAWVYAKTNPPTNYSKPLRRRLYTTHWALAPSFDWANRRDWWFAGRVPKDDPGKDRGGNFRCATKPFVIMLFLRLQELRFLKLSDEVAGQPGIAWTHIFSNTVSVNGSVPGQNFTYLNPPWHSVPAAVKKATSMNFLDAMQFYVLDPMGAEGQFDVNTNVPPFPARGYEGPLDDLLLLGSTLANGGISPKTGKRVITAESVSSMLEPRMVSEAQRESFFASHQAQTMARFVQRDAAEEFPFGVVEGYALGLWQVRGWHRGPTGEPLDGWLARGSSEVNLYFDKTGLVIAMYAPKRVLGCEATAPFGGAVRAIGGLLTASLFRSQDPADLPIIA